MNFTHEGRAVRIVDHGDYIEVVAADSRVLYSFDNMVECHRVLNEILRDREKTARILSALKEA